MQIVGIGVDIVELSRIAAICEKREQAFAEKIFTEKERADAFLPQAHIAKIAARFATKEAVSKALGTGIGKVGWQEIETLNDAQGRPFVRLYGNAQALAQEMGVKHIHVSLSHERTLAIAMIVLEG